MLTLFYQSSPPVYSLQAVFCHCLVASGGRTPHYSMPQDHSLTGHYMTGYCRTRSWGVMGHYVTESGHCRTGNQDTVGLGARALQDTM